MSRQRAFIRTIVIAIICMVFIGGYHMDAFANEITVEEKPLERGCDLDGFPLVHAGDWLFQIKAEEAIVIAYLGNESKVRIPDAVLMNNKSQFEVRAIGKEAFAKSNSNFSKAKGRMAGTTVAGMEHNWKIDTITIHKRIDAIAEAAFQNNSSITSVTILDAGFNDDEKNKLKIGDSAFKGCTALTTINLSQQRLISLGNSCFYGCSALERITIPGGVTEIPSSCFEKCTNLDTVIISNGLDTISNKAFFDCINLKNITISNGNSHPNVAIDLPDSITSIGNSAFENCVKIETAHIPTATGLKKINSRVFANCRILQSVIIPPNIESIGSYSFAYRVYGEEPVFDLYNQEGMIVPVIFTEGVKEIDAYAFYDIPIMKTVSLPYSIEKIGDNAFGFYESKAGMRPIPGFEITCYSDTAAEDYANENGFKCVTTAKTDVVVEYKDASFKTTENRGEVTLTHVEKNDITSYKVPKTIKIGKKDFTVTAIGEGAFSDCKLLKSVTIEEEVKTIGPRAFYGCKALETVKIGDKVTNIDAEAFSGCKKLKTLTLGSGVEKIGAKAFYKCKKLEKVTIKSKKLKKIGSKAFSKTSKKAEYTVPSKKLKSYQKKLKKAGAPKTVTYKKAAKTK